jgi:hypothetical protein
MAGEPYEYWLAGNACLTVNIRKGSGDAIQNYCSPPFVTRPGIF